MERSNFLRLSWRDFFNGLLVAVGTAVFIALRAVWDTNSFEILSNTELLLPLVEVAISAGLAYISKNVFENKNGKLGRLKN